MKTFTVSFDDFVMYEEVEAETKEEAIERALEWWSERTPNITVEEDVD